MDKQQLDRTFESCRDQLRSFLLRMTASVEDAEDLTQDTYLRASSKWSTFREESSLKTWIFSIASNLAKDHLRARQLWPQNATDICRQAALSNKSFLREMMQIRMTSPQGQFEIREHITFCFTCVNKSLPLLEQLALLLKEVYQFKVKEIAQILDVGEGKVKHLLRDARHTMIRIFDHRCSLIKKEGVCYQCSELNGIFNPKQVFQEELMKIEMAREAKDKSSEDLFDLRMKIVQAIDPFHSDASDLQLYHLKHNKGVIEEYLDGDNDGQSSSN